MSSYAFDWSATPELDDPVLNSPRPCFHGAKCTYTGADGCAFVHPGEEGSGRRIFKSRVITKNGVQTWQKSTVRLVSFDGSKVPFYERRMRKMSWPAWIKHIGAANAVKGEPVTVQEIEEGLQATPSPSNTECLKAKSIIFGDALYAKIDELLNMAMPMLVSSGEYRPCITSPKITGMLLEGLDSETLSSVMKDDMALAELMEQAKNILIKAN
jgi:hypothetical protein